MIRKLEKQDINEIMDIWLNTNILTHEFISEEYWNSNFESVKKEILNADNYVFEENSVIEGFIGIINGYIAGIFVRKDKQSKGIGKKLIEYCKSIHPELTLKVYQKNKKAIKFYHREKFETKERYIDEKNREIEILMSWRKK